MGHAEPHGYNADGFLKCRVIKPIGQLYRLEVSLSVASSKWSELTLCTAYVRQSEVHLSFMERITTDTHG